ncbi:MAG: hypothetical protein KDI19_00715 [Pseudomonadales bacterium]|nr:hypothetical protein [Pseudomonadales bacterium]
MIVVFIYGPAAAGKYTIGSLLSDRTGLPLFHNHLAVDAAKVLFEFGSASFIRMRAEIWRLAFAEAASQGRSFIFTFQPEATVDPGLIDELVSTVEKAGGQVLFVQLECSTATTLQRLGNESRTRFGKLIDTEAYLKVRSEGGFEFPPMPVAAITIDTERMDPVTAAATIERKMRELAP